MTFRLPWVSRSHHDAVLRDHVALNDAFREAKLDAQHGEQDANRRYDALLEKYHALASPVALTAPASAPTHPVERAEPSAISKVIREQSATADGRTDHALDRHLRKYARELKAEGKTEDEILGKLVEWQSSEPLEHVAEVAN